MSQSHSDPIQLRVKPPGEPASSVPPEGRIVTFYSYKGGTGRSMALANVAWLLALNGKRVLVVDWDLEAPGIHRYFHPFMEDKELLSSEGLLDFVVSLAAQAATSSDPLAGNEVDFIDYIIPLEWPRNSHRLDWAYFGPRARIDLLAAGRQGPAYARNVSTFNWVDFYERLGGRRLLNLAREQMKSIYDYVLIDSRTGVSDTSGICTVEMPDTLVICFTLNQQSIVGASAIAESVLAIRSAMGAHGSEGNSRTDRPHDSFRILPVPARVEITAERDKLRVGLELAQRTFAPFLDHAASPSKYWGGVQMAYFPFYAFEEIPAIFGDKPDELLALSTSIKQLTSAITYGKITDGQPLAADEEAAERVRREVVGWYLRHAGEVADAVRVAQEIFDRLAPPRQVAFLNAISRLVQVGERGAMSATAAPLAQFGERQALLAPFADAKLVVVTDAGGARTAAFADPILLDKWTVLRDWVEENRQFLVIRQTLGMAMQSWNLALFDENLLLRGKPLDEALSWSISRPADLSEAEQRFVRQSAEHAKQTAEVATQERARFEELAREVRELRSKAGLTQGRWWERVPPAWGWAIGLACLLALVVIGYNSYSNMQKREELAANRAKAAAGHIGDLYQKDPLTAILLALEIRNRPEARVVSQYALEIATAGAYPSVLLQETTPVSLFEFSPDGKLVVTADNTGAAQVLDTTSWSKIAEFEDSSGNILSASFNGWPQGPADRIVTVGRDNYVRIWDLHGTRLFQFQASKVKAAGCPGPQAQLLVRKGLGASLGLNTADQARFGPGGSGILVRYTNVSSGFLPLPVLGPNTVVQVASGSIVTFSDKGDCLDVDSGANRTMSMFSQDGRFVVTLSGNGVLGAPSDVKIFRVQDWSEISSNLSATSVYAVDCSAENLAVADSAGISVIGTKNGIPRPAPFSLTLSQFALSCDGKLLAGSGLNSGNLSVWNTFTGVRNDLSAPTGFLGLQFNPAATRLMAASGDRTIRVWEIPHKPVPQDHSWDSLMNYFAQTTRACLTAEQRHTLLGEEPFEAMQGFFECQKRLKF